jgi:uroporphyrin-III C-methyltransferase / precorrin-2 dehydrogenase / sirohydrochlorin ferrochelatase
MQLLPVFMKVSGRRVVVVGGQTVAARRSELALRCGASVNVFAPELSGDFHDVAGHPALTHHRRPVEIGDLRGATLVFCASGSAPEDERVRRLATDAGVTTNVADRPELCDFTTASIIDRSPLVVAIGTEGASPVLGRMMKARLESEIPATYGRLARFVGERRGMVADAIDGITGRLRFWERLLDGPVASLVLAGREEEAAERFRAALAAQADARPEKGEVYLVGAGPGDPDLLTFRALRLMQRADVVLYDNLVSNEIMNLVRRDAERIFVGKQRSNHTVRQEAISSMLVSLAGEGKRVLRIKGGDPFIFGRGGEEIEMLAAKGIPFQVVPGITAAAGCAAYAGIPLTHRDHAHSVVFMTGHGKDGPVDIDWNAIIEPRQTVAIYMGLSQMGGLMDEFINHGVSPDLPAAVIDNGTRSSQQVVVATVGSLAQAAAEAGLRGPTIIIVGSVVTLHTKLNWFGRAAPVSVPAQ